MNDEIQKLLGNGSNDDFTYISNAFIPMGNQAELVRYNETKNINVTMFKHYLILIFAFIG